MRKSTMKKAMAVLLSAAMAATMFAGCGGDDKDAQANAPADNNDQQQAAEPAADDNQGDDAEAPAEEPSADYTDYSAGFPDGTTIQIPVYDRAFEGWNVTDNAYTRWVQSEFGDKYNVNVEYVAIGRTTEVQDYMQMIAAGTAPDIIMHYDMPQAVNYLNEGAMQTLDLDEIAYYAPTYYDKMADTIAKYGSIDGENVFFFAERDAIYYDWVTLIRQDWLDQVGAAMPTTQEELNEVGRKWKEAGLGTLGESLKNKSFTYEYGFFDDSISTEDYAKYLDLNVAPLTWKPSEDYLRNLNMQFNEGIIDQEFYMREDDAAIKAEFVAGHTGTYAFYIASNTDVIDSLLANDPNAKIAAMPVGVTVTGNNYYYKYPGYGMIMGINSTTSDEERAAVWMFLDWMIQPENLTFLQNGPEGEAYTVDADGLPAAVEGYDGEYVRSQNNNKDYWCLVQEILAYDTPEKTYKANLNRLAPVGYEDLVKTVYDSVQKNDHGVVTPIFTKAVNSTSEYSADLNALWQQLYVDLATCAPDEFDAKYAEACQTYLDAGYQEILDEKSALFAEGSYIAE